jgi:hypothetical protein
LTVKAHSIPIPALLGALTLALPAITGFTVEIISKTTAITSASSARAGSPARAAALTALLILQTVLATLAGTYLTPTNDLTCRLQGRWQALFRAKDGRRIRAIQDALECCGFRSTNDMAYPFPSSRAGNPPSPRCAETFDRDRACLGPWRAEERTMAGILLIIVMLVVLWQVLVLVGPRSATAWFGGRRRDEERQVRGAVAYDEDEDEDAVERYTDDAGENVERGRRAIQLPDEFTSGVQPSTLPDSREQWR